MTKMMVSLLRGVNLGPHNRVKMDALRKIYEDLGLQQVRTLLQSGNVVFRAEKRELPELAGKIEAAIEKHFKFRAPVVLRTSEELQQVVALNPFAKRKSIDPAKVLVTFLVSAPTAGANKKVAALNGGPEEFYLCGRELYIYYANGMARPKVLWTTTEKMLGTTGTGRNWNTVKKLAQMMTD